MPSVAILVFPNVQALDVSGPMDVFEETNAFVSSERRYDVTLIGPPELFRASNGMPMAAHTSYEAATRKFDLVLVAGGPALPSEAPDDVVLSCVRRLAALATCYGSICTGAFILGHAGLLDGKHVTTHWQNADALAQQFPLAEVDRDRIYIRDGALLTSAGVTAGIDLALAIVNGDHGSAVALAVAKRLVVVAQRQGGQSQFSPYIAAPPDDSSPLALIYRFVMSNLNGKLSVSELADHAGMSRRNFARFFLQEAKTTPGDFVEQARVDAARNLLEGSPLALKEIAYQCGFGTPHRMRQVFAKRLGVTPGQYRASFRRPL
ncbi:MULTISPECIES: GlxA family transcriptional regulator [Rhizobium]|uniref:Transcriptional regulator, AraC family with amidase-like domain n=1 Tax=Rhizobium miluonense TaxID=411945 RepID=A0A1C3UZE3_9HYPH|nr:GlxA family transcriptional regulator [Rhizobium miluonense]SCB20851.1 transcriptional regulator, AraC family with amidase-like domain [Rhizobium miluonense]